MNKPDGIVIFDGECILCSGIIRFLLKRDRRKLKYAAMQTAFAKKIIKDYYPEFENPDAILFVSNGKVFQKSDGILETLKIIGGIWKVFYILRFLPRRFRDLIYDLIAKNRYRLFGKRNDCMMLSPGKEDRFIL